MAKTGKLRVEPEKPEPPIMIGNIATTPLLPRRHLDYVERIDRSGAPPFWSKQDFQNVLSDQTIHGRVVEDPETYEIGGFVVYKIHQSRPSGGPDRIQLVNIGVQLDHRRMGIGSALVESVAQKYPRSFLGGIMSERNLIAQLFLKKLGFSCTSVEPMAIGGKDDGYNFERPPIRPK